MPTEIDEDVMRGREVIERSQEIFAFWNAVKRLQDAEADVISAANSKARRKALGDEE